MGDKIKYLLMLDILQFGRIMEGSSPFVDRQSIFVSWTSYEITVICIDDYQSNLIGCPVLLTISTGRTYVFT